MRERLDSVPKPVIVIGLLILVWQLWRMFMPLPPDFYIRWMYPPASPAVSSSDGEVVSYDDSDTVVDGVYPVPWGVVAVYHSQGGHGWTVMRKGWFWWRDAVSGPVSLVQAQPDDDVTYGVGIPYNTVSSERNDPTNGLRWGQLLAGRRVDPAVQSVRVTFDDGSTQEARMIGDRFMLFSTEHGAVCELTTIGKNGEHRQTRQVDSFVVRKRNDPQELARFGFDTNDLDCAGVW